MQASHLRLACFVLVRRCPTPEVVGDYKLMPAQRLHGTSKWNKIEHGQESLCPMHGLNRPQGVPIGPPFDSALLTGDTKTPEKRRVAPPIFPLRHGWIGSVKQNRDSRIGTVSSPDALNSCKYLS